MGHALVSEFISQGPIRREKLHSTLNMQSKYRDTDMENNCMDTKGGKGGWDKLGDWD